MRGFHALKMNKHTAPSGIRLSVNRLNTSVIPMKVILQRVTYSGQDIGNNINVKFEVNNLAGTMEKSGIDTSSFDTLYPKRRCWLGHTPGHILAAQELANWIDKNPALFGTKQIIKPDHYPNQSGIIFIQNGWGTTDHIDVWDGTELKGGSPDYTTKGKEVWFWKI